MVKIEYLSDFRRFGYCIGCEKESKNDAEMVRVTFKTGSRKETSFCLCKECRRELYEKI